MVLHRPAYYAAWRTWRKWLLVTAYAVVMVAGTALLIVALHAHERNRVADAGFKPAVTAEVVMQDAAQQALASPKTASMAGNMN